MLYFRHRHQKKNGKIAHQFGAQWNFPNCIGAMDGKHIVMKQLKNSGSFYSNYKGTFSIVLLALVDANYNFLYVDIGGNGKISDGGVFPECTLSRSIERDLLEIPAPRKVGEDILPYVIAADDAFPLERKSDEAICIQRLDT